MARPVSDEVRKIGLELDRAPGLRLRAEDRAERIVQVQTLGGLSPEVVETPMVDVGTVEVENQRLHRLHRLLTDQDPEPCLGKVVGPARHDLLADEEHVGRKRAGGRRGNAPGLAQESDRRVNEVLRQAAGVRQYQAVRRERDVPLAHAGAQDEAALHVLGLEGRGRHRAGLLGPQAIAHRRGRARQDRFYLFVRRLTGDEGRARQGAGIEVDRDEVGHRLGCVRDRDEEIVLLAAPDGLGMAEGEREVGVPHEHGARCLARDRDRTDGQAFERGPDFEIDLVRAFPQSLDREVRLARFRRPQEADVVGSADRAVRTGVVHGHGAREKSGCAFCYAQRVISGCFVRAGD